VPSFRIEADPVPGLRTLPAIQGLQASAGEPSQDGVQQSCEGNDCRRRERTRCLGPQQGSIMASGNRRLLQADPAAAVFPVGIPSLSRCASVLARDRGV